MKRGEVVVRGKLLREIWSAMANARLCASLDAGCCAVCKRRLEKLTQELVNLGFAPKLTKEQRNAL